MKKFLLTLLCCIFLTGSAEAMVKDGGEEGLNYDIKYPIVELADAKVSARINDDIDKYVDEFRRDFKRGKFTSGATRYEVRYENDKIISLTLSDYRYMMGAAHGNYTVYGLVYDKATGRRIPLKQQARLKLDDLKAKVYSSFYNIDGEKLQFNSDFYDVVRVPDDYYVDDSGAVYVIFQTYELDCYAAGATVIKLEKSEIDFFNRKNG